ncbi:MAG TPA: site-2 protease family protein [Gammaproteobacteria bacterium]|nr:site-2 protease family protein [Gammaproteobacteria bacterium]
MPDLNLIQKIAIWVIPVLLAVTLHEAAHGWVANRLGDPTARMLGRLTLNPLKHIDPIGTILVPAILLLLPGRFLFGWAKPVPISPVNFKSPRRDMAIVGAAGPMANLLMAVLWCLVGRLSLYLPDSAGHIKLPLALLGVAGIFVNVLLMVFNLLPLPPLDGGRVASGLMPRQWARVYDRIEPYGFWILLLLIATNVLGFVLWPPVSILLGTLAGAAGFGGNEYVALLQMLM